MRVLYDSMMVEDGVEKTISKMIESENVTFMHDTEEIQIGGRYYEYPAPEDAIKSDPEPTFEEFMIDCFINGVIDVRGFKMREKDHKQRYNNYKQRNYRHNNRGGYGRR